jgi:very-short-patch-repair endonuclease
MPVAEYRFAPPRRWRFDYAFPEFKLAVEIEGGAWIQGRHTRGKGFLADLEKYNAATLLGWAILRYPPGSLDRAALDVEAFLGRGP